MATIHLRFEITTAKENCCTLPNGCRFQGTSFSNMIQQNMFSNTERIGFWCWLPSHRKIFYRFAFPLCKPPPHYDISTHLPTSPHIFRYLHIAHHICTYLQISPDISTTLGFGATVKLLQSGLLLLQTQAQIMILISCSKSAKVGMP